MGLMRRFANTIRGKANALLDSVENPVQSLDLKIRDANDEYLKAKSLTAQVIGNANRIKTDLEKANKERNDLEKNIQNAFTAGNEDLAKRLIAKKLKADAKVSDLLQRSNAAADRADKAKSDLLSLEDKLLDLKDYRSDAKSRFNTAKVTTKLNQMQGINSDIDTTNIEDMIQREEDKAYGLDEISKASNEVTLAKAIDDVAVTAEFAKYKAEFNKKS